jgi:hypothetical protein
MTSKSFATVIFASECVDKNSLVKRKAKTCMFIKT